MKPHATVNPHAIALDSSTTTGKVIFFNPPKSKKRKIATPPDEATCARLNAMAKQFPFSNYYKEKNHDPL
jgi:hypothetical protein